MDFIKLTIDFLGLLAKFVGNYGWAIILLTVIVRLAMWKLNVEQQRSMKMMQTLQPKLKAIQDRYKSNPQVMQQKLMEFYKEHKFNPMGGCLPLLIQMPIFILLYSALISPQFIQVAGNQHFFFVDSLATTLRATAGISNDGKLGVAPGDKFILGNTATVYLPDKTANNIKITDPTQAIEVQGELIPGEDVVLTFSLDHIKMKFSELEKVEKADVTVTNSNIRENENITFIRNDCHCSNSTYNQSLALGCYNSYHIICSNNVYFTKNNDGNDKNGLSRSDSSCNTKIYGNLYAINDTSNFCNYSNTCRSVAIPHYK